MDERNKAKRNLDKARSLGPAAGLLGQILEQSGREELDESRMEAGRKLQELGRQK